MRKLSLTGQHWPSQNLACGHFWPAGTREREERQARAARARGKRDRLGIMQTSREHASLLAC
eukprot:6201565-Pleurochrysis_carterae.AAC.2